MMWADEDAAVGAKAAILQGAQAVGGMLAGEQGEGLLATQVADAQEDRLGSHGHRGIPYLVIHRLDVLAPLMERYGTARSLDCVLLGADDADDLAVLVVDDVFDLGDSSHGRRLLGHGYAFQ